MSRKKGDRVRAAAMGAAFFFTCITEAVDGLEEGLDPISAAKRAMDRGKVRAKAMKKASRKAAQEIQKKEMGNG
jgi:hypothetical protein